MNATLECCHCGASGNERALKVHIAKAHAALAPPQTFGRSSGQACPLCGWVHTGGDLVARPDWADNRKRYERGMVASVSGIVRRPNQWLKLGEIQVPLGARRLKFVDFNLVLCKGPFEGPHDEQRKRYCLTCKRHHLVALEVYGTTQVRRRIQSGSGGNSPSP